MQAFSYADYAILKARTGALAAAAAAAESAAVAAMIGSTAAALGAGVLGWMIGESILKSLERPEVIPNPGDYWDAGNVGEQAVITFSYYVNGVPVFQSIDSVTMPTPIRGPFYRSDSVGTRFFVRDGNNTERPLVGSTLPQPGARLVIEGFKTSPGSLPITPNKKLPTTAPNSPAPLVPQTVPLPIPGRPDYPITPTVVPNPDNSPQDPEKEVRPGVIVKIPELGLQIRYAPDGVTIGKYKGPDTEPFEVPENDTPDQNRRVAAPPCPCPETDVSEMLCRIKAIQDGVLDDGFNYTTTVTSEAQSYFSPATSLVYDVVEIDVLSKPSNSRVQPSTLPVPDVIYIGWFSWLFNSRPGLREPLHFSFNAFKAPEGANGFCYQLYSGCTGRARYITKVERPYVDNC